MKTYNQLKAEHQAEMNSFEGIFFAFDNEQFDKGMEKIGLKKDETSKIFRMPAGGFILKTRAKDFNAMLKRHSAEMKKLRKDRKQLEDALIYELCNHEYNVTYDPQDALDALGLKKEQIPADILKAACVAASRFYC